MDLIKVTNIDTKPLVLNGNTRYEIAPGASRILPWDEAASWFGDPRLTDGPRHKDRTEAHRLAQNMWGYTEGMKYPVDWNDISKGFLTWDDMRPKIACEDMDGNPVYFLIDDLDGTKPLPGTAPALIDPSVLSPADLLAQMQAMQKQMTEMQVLLAARAQYDEQVPKPSQAVGPQVVPPTAAQLEAANLNAEADAAAQLEADSGLLPAADPNETVTDDAPRTVPTKKGK